MNMFLCCICKTDLEVEFAYFLNKGFVESYKTSINTIHPGYSNVSVTYKVIIPDNLKCFCSECFEAVAGKDYL